MFSTNNQPQVYTPEQVADLLQLSKNNVYDLIARGEIIAKKIGKLYRIPASSLSFFFTGLDFDLYQADEEDLKYTSRIQQELSKVRADL